MSIVTEGRLRGSVHAVLAAAVGVIAAASLAACSAAGPAANSPTTAASSTSAPAGSSTASSAPGGGTVPALKIPTVAADVGATGIPPFYTPPKPLSPGAPGTLIRAELVTGVPTVPAGARVWRVLYHSRTIYGHDLAESGYVVAPAGSPPAGGWPVLAWAHGTSGFSGICAPSLFTSQGGAGPYLIPGLADYLKAGFVIAATDYQGLGTPGLHPYLLGLSEGRAVLDAARAARRLPGLHPSDKVIIYGHSQGGQSALFAGEIAPSYAPDLHVLGVAAAAPATGLTTILSVAAGSFGQSILGFTLPAAYSWTKTYRDLPTSELFTPAGARFAAKALTHGCTAALGSAIAAQHMTPASVFKKGFTTDPALVAHAKLNDPGRVKELAPMLVVQGTADTTVPPALTDGYVTGKACKIGDRIDYLHVTGATHGTVVFAAVPTLVSWMTARLRGSPAPTTCGRPGDVAVLSP